MNHPDERNPVAKAPSYVDEIKRQVAEKHSAPARPKPRKGSRVQVRKGKAQ